MRVKQVVIIILVCTVAVPLLRGQSAASDEIKFASQPYTAAENGAIRVQSTIVDVNVVVRDEKGQLVKGLKKEDFEIYDQGKKQIISLFNVELAHPAKSPPPEEMTGAPPPAPPAAAPPRFLA